MDWQRFRIGINQRRTLWLELERRKTTDKTELAEVAKEGKPKPASWGGRGARGKLKRLRLRAPWNKDYPSEGI